MRGVEKLGQEFAFARECKQTVYIRVCVQSWTISLSQNALMSIVFSCFIFTKDEIILMAIQFFFCTCVHLLQLKPLGWAFIDLTN